MRPCKTLLFYYSFGDLNQNQYYIKDYDSNPRAKIVPKNTFVEKDVCAIQKPQNNILNTIIQFFKSVFNTLFGWLFRK